MTSSRTKAYLKLNGAMIAFTAVMVLIKPLSKLKGLTEMVNVFALIAIVTVFLMANIWLALKDRGVVSYALPVTLLAGFMMLVLLAPGSAPDEKFHYYSSLKLSNVLLFRSNINEMECEYEFTLEEMRNANDSFVMQKEGLFRRGSFDNGTMEVPDAASPYRNFISHLAPAIGMSIGRLLRLNFISVYFLARLFNLIQYALLAYLAVRLVPVNKELMLMIALMPMPLQQCTGTSYDSVLNGLSMVFIAYVLKIINSRKRPAVKELVICLILLILLAPVKIVYILLAIMLLAISKDYLIKALPVFIVAGVVLFMIKGDDIMAIASGSYGEEWWTGGLEAHNIAFLYQFPLRYIKAIIYSLEMDGITYIKDAAGIGLCAASVTIPDMFAIGYLLVMFLCALSVREYIVPERWQRVMILITSVMGIMAIFTVFLFGCTVYGRPRIMGAQGRYFLPFLIPAIYCLKGKRIHTDIERSDLLLPAWFILMGYVIFAAGQVSYAL